MDLFEKKVVTPVLEAIGACYMYEMSKDERGHVTIRRFNKRKNPEENEYFEISIDKETFCDMIEFYNDIN